MVRLILAAFVGCAVVVALSAYPVHVRALSFFVEHGILASIAIGACASLVIYSMMKK